MKPIKPSKFLNLTLDCFRKETPKVFENIEMKILNEKLLFELGLDVIEEPTKLLSGQTNQTDPIALAYAGHQFGNFVPQLGDGRAHLLGEVTHQDGVDRELQLKGSGPTYYSRGGDGLSPLMPALREFLVSESLYHLNIPTTRSLAVFATNEDVYRSEVEPGGIVLRSSLGHIRVGSFEYFIAKNEPESLLTYMTFIKEQFFHDLDNFADMFSEILSRQAKLIANWMSIGFIHGVMNTDNTHILGETIDYGPCAFMNRFSRNQVYSSIDRRGRYAYGNQPAIAGWNLSVLAGAFVFALGEKALPEIQKRLNTWEDTYTKELTNIFSKKFGLTDNKLSLDFIEDWFSYLEKNKLDFTLAHRNLSIALKRQSDYYPQTDDFKKIIQNWMEMIKKENKSLDLIAFQMDTTNPLFIPRNHQLDKALRMASQGDDSLYNQILAAVRSPFQDAEELSFLKEPPKEDEDIAATFCGT